MRALNPSLQTTRDEALTVSFVEINLHKETERSETSQVKRCARADSEAQPRGCLNHSHGAFLLGVPWPVASLCLLLSRYLVCLRVFPCARASFSQDVFHCRGLWVG